jgi:hypothetical protein
MGHGGDHEHRRQHEPDCEQADRSGVFAQVAERGEERRSVEEWRQNCDQHEIRWKLDLWDAGHEAQAQASDHEQDRVGDPHQLGDDQEQRDRDQDCGENETLVGRKRHVDLCWRRNSMPATRASLRAVPQ